MLWPWSMPATSKRLEFMQKATASGSADPLAWYGLAMEYRSLERHDEALVAFESLREKHPEYVAAYLMCGQMLEKMGRVADAKAWLAAGLAMAQKKGDAHAASELEGALAGLG